jgi:DNA-binding transcriptional ArsR family regulator
MAGATHKARHPEPLIQDREGCAVEKPDRRPKAKEDAQKAKPAKGAGSREPYEEDDLISALNHPLRRQILRLLHSSGKPLSPTEIEKELALGKLPKGHLSTVSYHVTALARHKTISKVDEQPVRGAVEHFYESRVSGGRWVRDLLKRMQKKDEGLLWPGGRSPSARKAPEQEKR